MHGTINIKLLMDMCRVLCLCAVLYRGWSVNIPTHMKFLLVILWLVVGWLSVFLTGIHGKCSCCSWLVCT